MFRPLHLTPYITRPFLISNYLPTLPRFFTLSALSLANKALPPRLKIQDADVTISYLKGTGPGGQKINKTNSAVQIIHKPTGVVVKSQATRSRSQNEKIARQLLADKVEELLNGDQSRAAIKADRARKKKASKMKKSRRKYRELEDGKESQEIEEAEEENDAPESADSKHESKLEGADIQSPHQLSAQQQILQQKHLPDIERGQR
ncbi:peptidyl-tRNA hydrolase domain protein [Aspergillus eucalypticola CBS 122712]|uniref:Peptidyl-tRNA hydrolase domain protein n=1 Tax=Aspergillus eucalypticola (strain CBS 122712 / IBT 29274) TaxID=1448314 RepID=A0A317W0D8_ASPEC|nr:peptidyl-tRNA hydrolase domain protein [Aspergillus eucalypticola CBS 122712]PWY78692.1 peptidyl-tRNA hydrolase domain protein [Aspergillus eucalypticola CBS 122712]